MKSRAAGMPIARLKPGVEQKMDDFHYEAFFHHFLYNSRTPSASFHKRKQKKKERKEGGWVLQQQQRQKEHRIEKKKKRTAEMNVQTANRLPSSPEREQKIEILKTLKQ